MQGFTSDQKLADVLQSNVPVLRNGRQVLAVKASLQNRIPGIVHEVSQTAQTVYVEPEEAVLCSNELIQKEFELQAVIKKILLELTESLQPSIPVIKQALPVMTLFDVTGAAAKWGTAHNCTYALEAKKEPPLLLKARHPLLGDIVYGSRKKAPFATQGQCLHAQILGFVHPVSGEYIETEAPLPEYFQNILNRLRQQKQGRDSS